ncbi:MAG: hypothetical protein ACYCUZ_03045 [Cuniculiplasma sp.]|jgi:hypothetical protein
MREIAWKGGKVYRLDEMNREQRIFYAIRRYMFPLRFIIIVLVIVLMVKL